MNRCVAPDVGKFMMKLALLANVATTLYMTGLIWFVQVVHYPLFAGVGRDRWAEYALAHQRLTTLVVGVPMLAELATAALLVLRPPAALGRALPVAGLVLALVAWASTALLQVPAHGRLTSTFDADVHRGLVAWNWVRTTAWSVRAGVVMLMLWRTIR
jgi:hypothetical protein